MQNEIYEEKLDWHEWPTTKKIEPIMVVMAIIYSGSEVRRVHVAAVPLPAKYAAHCHTPKSFLNFSSRTSILQKKFITSMKILCLPDKHNLLETTVPSYVQDIYSTYICTWTSDDLHSTHSAVYLTARKAMWYSFRESSFKVGRLIHWTYELGDSR